MFDSLLTNLGLLIEEKSYIAPLLALAAGLITSITPCSLSTLPLVMTYVGKEAKPKKAFFLSLTYALGEAITFTLMATIASLAGSLIGNAGRAWYFLLGALMCLMCLQIWNLYSFIPSTYLTSINKKRGYIGALFIGILSGLFSSPCSTPVLVSLLSIIAIKGKTSWGILLMLLYSIGCTALALIAGISKSFIRKLSKNKAFHKLSEILNYILGFLVLVIGLYMFYLAF